MIKFNNHATEFPSKVAMHSSHNDPRILPTAPSRGFNSFTQIPPSAPSHSRLSLNLLHGGDLLFFNLNRVSAPFFRRQMFFLFTANATDDLLLSAMIFDVGSISGSDFL
jgi:hypothetical protein